MLESQALHHPDAVYLVTFSEGDQYLCMFENGELIDNAVDDPSQYEEWYEPDYQVIKTIVLGPNKSTEFDYIQISSL